MLIGGDAGKKKSSASDEPNQHIPQIYTLAEMICGITNCNLQWPSEKEKIELLCVCETIGRKGEKVMDKKRAVDVGRARICNVCM